MTENRLEYRSLPGLWRAYDAIERSLAFKAENIGEAQAWQARLRDELTTLLGEFPAQACDLAPQILETSQDDGFTRQQVAIQILPGEYMPCWVLTPNSGEVGNLKPVIALHGHGSWGGAAIT